MQSKAGSVARYLLLDILGSVLHFPLWWYTTGFQDVLNWVSRTLSYRWRSFNMALWLKSLFVPMYGQYDLIGRLVSVFMRLVVLIGRSIFLLVEASILLIITLLWLIAPLVGVVLFLDGLSRGFSWGAIQQTLY